MGRGLYINNALISLYYFQLRTKSTTPLRKSFLAPLRSLWPFFFSLRSKKKAQDSLHSTKKFFSVSLLRDFKMDTIILLRIFRLQFFLFLIKRNPAEKIILIYVCFKAGFKLHISSRLYIHLFKKN